MGRDPVSRVRSRMVAGSTEAAEHVMLVFADLDETLLNAHACRSSDRTWRALARIAAGRIHVVLCSSKTRAEVELIQQELGIAQPFVCESGAAVFVPVGHFGFAVARPRAVAGYDVVELGRPYGEVVSQLHRAAGRLGIEVIGFNDMSVADVALECDLPLLEARLAKLREYTEPFCAVDATPDEMARLIKALQSAGLGCTTRGRISHAGTVRRDIGVQFLCAAYRRAFGRLLTVAFGDSMSAVPLLQAADIALIVQDDEADPSGLLRAVPTARLTTVDSVAAWADLILELFAANAPRDAPVRMSGAARRS